MDEIPAAVTAEESPRGTILLRVIQVLAVVAAGVATYLLILSIGQKGLPVGCGAGSGCAEVLTSRWANLGPVPVTLPALLCYAGIFAASFAALSAAPARRRLGWSILLTLGASVALAAVWFLAIQVVVLKTLCPWCLAEHAVGLLLAALIAFGTVRSRVVSALGVAVAGMVAVFGTGLFALGQVVLTPPKAPLVRVEEKHNSDSGPGPDRKIAVLNGTLPLTLSEEPLIGEPTAPHVIVVFFDYCCPHCRETHGHLVGGMKKYNGQYALVVLPMPLDKQCNPHTEHTEPRFQNSCELARLALAVLAADRTKFPEFDEWLFEPEQPREIDDAWKKAESLVGKEPLETALGNERIAQSITRNVEAFDHAGQRLPVIMSPEFAAIIGRPADEEQLFEALKTDLKLVPPRPPK